MKNFISGNEAITRGAFEAGVVYACAYPGTPSTEILEDIAEHKEIIAEWAPNEKVAMEAAIGASIAGGRSLAAMKMVGVNVAADPLMSFAYTGVNGGMVLVTGDDPGLHSSQNEQDNRNYAKFAKIAMFEPSSSQECKDMMLAAFDLSEKYDTPVLFRVTTRICHSKGIVEFGERREPVKKPYTKNSQKYDLVPAISRKLHYVLEDKLKKLEEFSNSTGLNYAEYNDKKIGIVSAGVAYQYAKEVFGDTASYLKIGFSYPLPMDKIRAFAKEVETLYVIEELDPFMEEQIKAAGIQCTGKEKIPICGELNPDIIAKALLGTETPLIQYDASVVAPRPPILCAGCPHRGLFYVLAKYKKFMITGDIGCYGLGGAEPLNAKDTTICMGASFSMGHGAQKVYNKFNENKRTVGTMGDSTFFHTGVNSLMHIAYNKSNTISIILDNRITAMTGHQENPGTGFTLQGMPTKALDIPQLVRALGIDHIKVINPLNLKQVKEAIDWAIALDEPSVIVTRWPCVLKRPSAQDKKEFGDYMGKCVVDQDECVGCRACIRTGCPALSFNKDTDKAKIDRAQCVGCEVCLQVCSAKAISKEGK